VSLPEQLSHDALVPMVASTLKWVLAESHKTVPEPVSGDTRLIGKGGAIDSLGLVSLAADLEQRIEQEYGVVVSLLDDTAQSPEGSPFRTVGALAEHIARLLAREHGAPA